MHWSMSILQQLLNNVYLNSVISAYIINKMAAFGEVIEINLRNENRLLSKNQLFGRGSTKVRRAYSWGESDFVSKKSVACHTIPIAKVY